MNVHAMIRAVLACGIILAGCASVGGASSTLPEAPSPQSGDRLVLFVSDLHMGVGRDPDDPSRWHSTEDFRWHEEFDAFLSKLDGHGNSRVDLVILGDLFEMWQSLEDDCDYDDVDKNLGCTEEEAVGRLERILDQHSAIFDALGRFAKKGSNTITILPGNHDVALAFDGVRRAVIEAFPAEAAARVRIAVEGYWMSADGLVFAEHGHQIGKDANYFDGWPLEPFIDRGGTRYLLQPWGEQFVQKLYNRHEEGFPSLDNISEEIRGLEYILKSSGFLGSVKSLVRAARFFATQTSWGQTRQFLGEDGIPVWKIDDLRAELASEEERWSFLVGSFRPGDPVREALETVPAGERVGMEEYSPAEIQALCDRRWAISIREKDSPTALCSSTGQLGAMLERIGDLAIPGAKKKRYREHLLSRRGQIPDDQRPTRDFAVFIYGHTHKVETAVDPFGGGAGWKPLVYNDGAWQRTATPDQIEKIMACKKIPEKDIPEKIMPEDMAPCYPFITLFRKEEAAGPSVKVLSWFHPTGSPGRIASECPVDFSPALKCE